LKHKIIVLLIIILVIFTLVIIHMTKITKDSKNIDAPEACASEWLEDVITVQETLHCIDDYMEKMNDSEHMDENRDS